MICSRCSSPNDLYKYLVECLKRDCLYGVRLGEYLSSLDYGVVEVKQEDDRLYFAHKNIENNLVWFTSQQEPNSIWEVLKVFPMFDRVRVHKI